MTNTGREKFNHVKHRSLLLGCVVVVMVMGVNEMTRRPCTAGPAGPGLQGIILVTALV